MSDAGPSLTFSSEIWQTRFDGYGWGSFEALWQLQADTVEPANVRRGGWSSVVRIEAGDGAAFYLKRQEDHDFRQLPAIWRRTPTVVREWQAGIDFSRFGVGTAEPVCLGIDQRDRSRGLLVTAALDGYRSLPEVLQDRSLAPSDRQALWQTLARGIRLVHQQGYRHNCLYGHHIMISGTSSADWAFRLIDLEKVSRARSVRRAVISDLSALDRHTDDMSLRDRLWFWDCYFEEVPLAARRKVLLPLARRSAVRGVNSYLRDCASGLRD